MRSPALLFILSAISAYGQDRCPFVPFSSVRSAVLATSGTTHRVLAREGNSYTSYELTNTPPFNLIRTIPHFERQVSACSPSFSGFDYSGVIASAKTPSGGYIFAITNSQQTPSPIEIAVFSAGMTLVSETPASISPSAFADLNGDGNMDIIGGTLVGPTRDRAFAIALAAGQTGFHPPVPLKTLGGLVSIVGVAIADGNGDLKPDILIAVADSPGSGYISIFAGNGDGTFQAEKVVSKPQGSSAPLALAVDDLNGDRHPDIVFTANDQMAGGAFVNVALGSGDGSFSDPVAYSVADGRAVAIGDLNGDGTPDVVTSGVTILFGDGKGTFSSRRDFLVEARGNPIVTDFDGDGITDVVTAIGDPAVIAGDAVAVLAGLGKGEFFGPPVSQIPQYPSVDTLLMDVATADLNGDGVPDVVLLDNMGHVSVLVGSREGTFKATFQFRLRDAGLPLGVALGDFNHDGRLDLAVVENGSAPSNQGAIDIFPGNGDGTFQAPARTPAFRGALALASGDFNGDGSPDLAVLSSQETGGADSIQILLGSANGMFTARELYRVGPYAHSLLTGDFNGDGKLDLVVADEGTNDNENRDGSLALLAGKGDGTFNSPVITAVTGGPGRGPFTVAAADFNHDGKLDLALTLSGASRHLGGLMVMLGRGDATFQPPVNYAVEAATVQAEDLDGDGTPDLILSGDGVSSGIRYMLGNPDGMFRPPVTFSSDSALYAARTLALADFNGDGRLDIAAITQTGLATFLNEVPPTSAVSVVSAASFTPGPLAPDSLATAFGANFPASPDAIIKDGVGTTLPANVLFASSSQINFVVPAELEAGPATLTIGSQSAPFVIAPIAPSLFAFNSQGLGVAYVTRLASSGEVGYEPVAAFQNGVYTPIPIDVTSGSAYLTLFGTGLRNIPRLIAFVNGTSLDVTYAGPQPSFAGLDQVNVPLPASLAGSGCSNVFVSTPTQVLSSNALYVCIR